MREKILSNKKKLRDDLRSCGDLLSAAGHQEEPRPANIETNFSYAATWDRVGVAD